MRKPGIFRHMARRASGSSAARCVETGGSFAFFRGRSVCTGCDEVLLPPRDRSALRSPHRGDGSVQVVLTKIVTAKENTNAFAVIQAILAEGGVGGFYKGIQVGTVLLRSEDDAIFHSRAVC